MKLNNKRTLLVGFAFFLICVFWQAYDTLIPLMLTNKFGLGQTWSGFIMSLDNILALFMLPVFGALSDKTNTRFGKRTPFIFIGTICAIVCFVGLSFVDYAQLKKIETGSPDTYWSQNYDGIQSKEYQSLTNNKTTQEFTVRDYAARVYFSDKFENLTEEEKKTAKFFDMLTEAEKQELQTWYTGVVALDGVTYKGKEIAKLTDAEKADLLAKMPRAAHPLNFNSSYVYDRDNDSYRLCVKTKNGAFLFGSATYNYVDDNGEVAKGSRVLNAYSSLVSPGEQQFAASVTHNNVYLLVIFIIVLLMTLISMATFRSPAVALMPDVTVKPLRSKANAIINLMGTAGGILVLVLGMVFGTGSAKNQLMNYTWFIMAVCGIMAVALTVFVLTVKEKRWGGEMLLAQADLDATEQQNDNTCAQNDDNDAPVGEEQTAPKAKEKLPKDKLTSLILILASVALWFTGYNAVTSKYSVYAINELGKDYNTTLLIAQAAAVAAYIPVGMLASKIGRKKSILIGVGLLTAAFGGAIFVDSTTPSWLMTMLFALAGIAWATINVNSFPMVVELAKGGDTGKYTGYYYTASMAAQVITPILSGALMDYAFKSMRVLFPYATIFVALSFVTMIFVKHGDSAPTAPKSKMEMLAGADDD